jgi:hypothetical protein
LECFSPGFGVSAARLGDFDRDGVLDALAVTLDGAVWMRGDGVGGFGAPTKLLEQPLAPWFEVRDFDGDGWLDLATVWLDPVWFTPEFLVYALGDGAGGLAPARRYANIEIAGLNSADLDADGDYELVVTTPAHERVTFDFAAGVFMPVATFELDGVWSIVGDFDGDGLDDIAGVKQLPGAPVMTRISVGLSDGAGGLRAREAFEFEFNAWDIVAVDVDGDGKSELVSASTDGLRLHRREGQDTYRTHFTPRLACSRLLSFNADGDLDGDLLVKTETAPAGFSVARAAGNTFVFELRPLVGTTDPADLAAGDLNNDGYEDLVLVETELGLCTSLSRGSQGLRKTHSVPDTKLLRDVATGDLDGDGVSDIAALTWVQPDSSQLQIYLSSASFALVESLTHPDPPLGLAFADLDGDLDLDVVVALHGSPARTWSVRNNGGGVFTPLQTVDDPHNAVREFGDLNGDGFADAVSFDSGLRVRLGDGAGGFLPDFTPAGSASAFRANLISDVDADGLDDVVVLPNAAPYRVQVYRGSASAVLAPPIESPVSSDVAALVAGDFNGDTRVDLAWITWGPPQQLTLAFGDASGAFGSTTSTTPLANTSGHLQRLIAARVDGDLQDDILLSRTPWTPNSSASSIDVALSGSGGTLGDWNSFALAGFESSLWACADFSGDQRGDLLFYDELRGLMLVRQ